MTLPSKTEIKQRIKFLQNGPWAKKSSAARSVIANRATKQKRLEKLLKPHWKGGGATEKDTFIRDSFDEALTQFQLYELAIESGYIAVDDIHETAKDELTQWLCSPWAQKYIRDYDYLAVAFLAKRLDVDIDFDCTPPAVRESSQVRFATFLSQHRAWYEDAALDGWIGFLDDYGVLDLEDTDYVSDKDIFYDFIRSKTGAFVEELALWKFAIGAERFVINLSDLYAHLSKEEKPLYGSFYAYWLARYFGYDLDDKGYKRDDEQADWSKELLRSVRLKDFSLALFSIQTSQPRTAQKAFNLHWKELEKRNEMCLKLWKTTQRFLEKHMKVEKRSKAR